MKLKSFFGSLGLAIVFCSVVVVARLHGTTVPGDDDSAIAKVTARLLENSGYTGHHEPEEISGKFLNRYLEVLDPNHLYFLQSDLAEFAPYRTNLEKLTIRSGDTQPAHIIFERFQQRLEQRIALAQELLKTESFDFTGNDTYRWDRRKAPRPRDLAEAKQLWRQNLRYEYLQEKLSNKKPDEIVKTLSRRYERTLRAMKQWNADQVLEIYLTALTHAYDPHSDYMGRHQMEDFSIAMNLSLFGVGATLQGDDGYCKIVELLPGGPAARSKLLKVGDRIVAVAQEGKEPVDIIDMPLPDAVELIRGPKGTKVSLTIIPAGSTDSSVRKSISLVRDEIKLEDQAAKARIVDLGGQTNQTLRIGIIDLPSFYSSADSPKHSGHKSATADVARLIDKLKQENVQGLVLDLRRNGGGSLEEAIALTGLFIKKGPVVQTRDTDGDIQVENDPDSSAQYDGPLVVLISHLSASASEILAGALQDYGRALIVGDSSTFGKGTVQSILPLSTVMRRLGMPIHADPGALKLTIRQFFRPSGASTQLKGVSSDILLPSPTERLKISEAEMPNPLPWDKVPPARYTKLDRVEPWLLTLRAASTQRAATNQDLVWLREDIDRANAQLTNPVVSLNEQLRLREKGEEDARAEARKKERATRQPALETQYEITLKNVDQSGLPAPTAFASQSQTQTNAVDELDNEIEAPEHVRAARDQVADPTLEEAKQILVDYIGLLRDGEDSTVARHATTGRVGSF
jgi:carboxyl-terminal processing protease